MNAAIVICTELAAGEGTPAENGRGSAACVSRRTHQSQARRRVKEFRWNEFVPGSTQGTLKYLSSDHLFCIRGQKWMNARIEASII